LEVKMLPAQGIDLIPASALHTFAKEHALDPDTAQWERIAKALAS
jgi:hypothetical protein